MPRPYPLNFKPGVQRDGTRVDSECSVDAQWTRWRMGRPRKMGGYRTITSEVQGKGRRIFMYYKGGQVITHIGHSHGIEQVVFDTEGNFISRVDRTPPNFIGGIEPGWTIDALFDTTSEAIQLLAHSTPNVGVIADNVRTPPFVGLIDAVTPLAQLGNPDSTFGGNYTQPQFSGGLVCVQPFLFSFDSDGRIGWSAPNIPDTLGVSGGNSGAGIARVSAQKFLSGMPLRGGGGNSPAALFWSLSEVVTANFTGPPEWFRFNTPSPSSSILAGATTIEYDGLYYWAGVDRFLMFNGTVVEVPNNYNADWFFDNMNWAYAGKSFAFKVPRFGEIWFCAPLFGATEPSHAVIYNTREKCWYDTVLPDGGRSAGFFAQGFRFPVMSGVSQGADGFQLWLHETRGKNRIDRSGPQPIRAYVSTPFMGGPMASPPDSHGLSVGQLEADMLQTGDMAIVGSGGSNPRGSDIPTDAAILKADPATADEQLVGVKMSRRYLRMIFESNTMNGDFVFGRNILHVEAGDQKMSGGVGKPLSTPPDRTAIPADPPLTIPSTPLSDFTEE